MIIFLAGLRQIPQDLYEAASLDGASKFAMSILSLLPIFVFFLFFQRLLIEGIATTGMKR